MTHELTTIVTSLFAIGLGTSIAIWHLSLLDVSLSSLAKRQKPARFLFTVSFLRILSIGLLLLIVARQLEAIPLILFLTSFIFSRMIFLPRFLKKPTRPISSSQTDSSQ